MDYNKKAISFFLFLFVWTKCKEVGKEKLKVLIFTHLFQYYYSFLPFTLGFDLFNFTSLFYFLLVFSLIFSHRLCFLLTIFISCIVLSLQIASVIFLHVSFWICLCLYAYINFYISFSISSLFFSKVKNVPFY